MARRPHMSEWTWRMSLVVALGLMLGACVTSNNRAPVIDPVADATFEAGVPNFIEVLAIDPDADPLEYELSFEPMPPSIAMDAGNAPRIEVVTHGAIITWTPRREDGVAGDGTVYVATLVATDGQGARAGRAFRLTVVDKGGGRAESLRFLEPVGQGVFADGPCLDDFPVQAGGLNDLASVSLAVESEGFSEHCGGEDKVDCPSVVQDEVRPGAGLLRWCPTEDLLGGQLHQNLTLVAEKTGSDLAARQPFFVRFAGAGFQDCLAPPAVISHTPPLDGVNAESGSVVARFDEVPDLKIPPVLAYVIRERGEQETPRQWQASVFERADGDLWRAPITTRLHDADPADFELVYQMVVSSFTDDMEAPCSTTARSEIFVVPLRIDRRTTGQGAQCDECQSDADCARDGSLCIPIESTGYCMRACDSVSDCDEGASCAEMESLDGAFGTQCVPNDLNCGQLCRPDTYEGQYGNNTQADALTLAIGEHEGLSICAEDADWYRIPVVEGLALRVQVSFDATAGDLDLRVHPPGVGEAALDSTSGVSSEEFVEIPCVRENGDAFVHVWGHSQAENAYGLAIELTPGHCDEVCEADEYETAEVSPRWRAVPVELPWAADRLNLCRGDVDRFFFRTESALRLTAELQHSGSSGSIAMRVYRGEAIVQEVIPRAEQDGRINWQSEVGATYVVEVAGTSAEAAGTYALAVVGEARPEPDQPCTDEECIGIRCQTHDECGDLGHCVPRVGVQLRGDEHGVCALRCDGDEACPRGDACKPMGGGVGVCLPVGAQGPGLGCEGHWECAGQQVCLDGPGGYCARLGCNPGDCDEATVCAPWGAERACLASCRADGDCRRARGYSCRRDEVRERRYCLPEDAD